MQVQFVRVLVLEFDDKSFLLSLVKSLVMSDTGIKTKFMIGG